MAPNSHNSSINANGSPQQLLSEEEVTRVAMRVSFSAWSQLQAESDTLTDAQVLKRYLALCPFVAQDSPAVLAAMEALDDVKPSNGNTTKHTSRSVIVESTDTRKGDETTDDAKTTDTQSVVEKVETKTGGTTRRAAGYILRWLFLDIPVISFFTLYMICLWVHRVHDLYLLPQMDAMVWTDQRSQDEITYFRRPCYREDLSTENPRDLFLSPTASPQDAYEHQLRHGFSVFPNVLRPETATALRDFVVSRNHNLSAEESIFVIENENRYSFGLGTETPAVAQAMSELATHELLSASLEKILGPNPALIEMTAITSTYGAVDQYWHDDVISPASAIQFGRTFGPSYSIFVQLQNTTKEMGATDSCPGTHMCPSGPLTEACEEFGFQLVNPEDGYWRAGDALLMNMNSWHRGAEHQDPDALDRVMLILTFAPKPEPRMESRQMSQGITFSLRWDMWGHTLSDLAHAQSAMAQPWATLRALGLFKLPGTDWGIDYVTSSSMRIANVDNGFRRDELDTFMERGGIHWLPKFLHGEYSDDLPGRYSPEEGESWYEFLKNTWLRCESFSRYSHMLCLGVYAVLFFLPCLVPGNFRNAVGGLRRALIRLAVAHGLVWALLQGLNYHVDSTPWAKDIKANRRFSTAFANQPYFVQSAPGLPSTFPHRNDVLFETRYGSPFLAMYNDYIKMHPGNQLYNSLVEDQAEFYRSYPEWLRTATVLYVVTAVNESQGRFLFQDAKGTWRWMTKGDAMKQVEFELGLQSISAMNKLADSFTFLISDYQYGIFRDTALAQVVSVPYLRDFQTKLLSEALKHDQQKQPSFAWLEKKEMPKQAAMMVRSFLDKAVTKAKRLPSTRTDGIPPAVTPEEPSENAWLKEGDLVEGRFIEGKGIRAWYKGTLDHVHASGMYHVYFADDDEEDFELDAVRRYLPYKIKERNIQVYHDEVFHDCMIVMESEGKDEYGDKTALYRVYRPDFHDFVEGVTSLSLRRLE